MTAEVGALILAGSALVTALASAIPGIIGVAQTKANAALIKAQEGRQNRQGEVINKMANGGGDSKIDTRLREHGLIPNLTPGTVTEPKQGPKESDL